MPVSINGQTGVVTGLAVGGLPDGTVDADTLASNAVTAAKLASGVGGKVLQVVSVVDSSAQQTINTTTYTDLGSLAAAITPSSSSNKVLIMTQVNVQIYAAHQESNGHSRIVRGSTELIEYPYFAVHEAGKSPSNRTVRNINHFQMYLDSPSTTSATTYKPQLKLTNTSYGQVLYYNQNTSKSVITVMEIAA